MPSNNNVTSIKKENFIHPFYNDGYDRYDLDINDIVSGLKNAGYDLDGEDDGNWWEDEDLGNLISYRLEVSSSNITTIDNEKYETTLSAKLYVNNKDVTNTTPANLFKWTRISGNSEINKIEDAEWNLRFAQGSKDISITRQDVNRRALFQCQFVKYNDEVEWVKNAYSTYTNLTQKEGD